MANEAELVASLMLGVGVIAATLFGSGGGDSADAVLAEADENTTDENTTDDNSESDLDDGPGADGQAADLPGSTASTVDFTWYREGYYDVRDSGDGPDTLSGLGGDDEIYGHQDEVVNNIIFGGELVSDYAEGFNFIGGNDTIGGGPGNDWLVGQAGDDIIFGQSGDDWLNGSPGDDVLFGGLGQDHVHGGTGNDRIFLGFGNDINMMAPVMIAMFEQGTVDDFHAAMDMDRDETLFIDNAEDDPEKIDIYQESGAQGMLVALRDVGTSTEALDRYGQNSDRLDQRLIYDNLGDDLIRGGARMTDDDGNYVDAPELEDGDDTLIDPMGSNTIFGDLGDDVLMAFDRDLYWADRDNNGIRDIDDPAHSEINEDTLFGGYGNDLIFADAGDTVTLDPVLDDVEFADRLVFGAEFSEYNTDKTINQVAAEVTDFNPEQDELLIMNYVQDDGAPIYEGELSFQAVAEGTAVTIGEQALVILQGVQPDQLTEGENVIHDTDKTPGNSAVGAIFANFNAAA